MISMIGYDLLFYHYQIFTFLNNSTVNWGDIDKVC